MSDDVLSFVLYYKVNQVCGTLTFVSRLYNFVPFLAAKINETDTFGPGDDDEIQFDDIGSDDDDIDDVSAGLLHFSTMSAAIVFFLYSMY